MICVQGQKENELWQVLPLFLDLERWAVDAIIFCRFQYSLCFPTDFVWYRRVYMRRESTLGEISRDHPRATVRFTVIWAPDFSFPARYRLYRRRVLRPNTNFAGFFEIYKIFIRLHRSDLKILVNTRPNLAGMKTIFFTFFDAFCDFSAKIW